MKSLDKGKLLDEEAFELVDQFPKCRMARETKDKENQLSFEKNVGGACISGVWQMGSCGMNAHLRTRVC